MSRTAVVLLALTSFALAADSGAILAAEFHCDTLLCTAWSLDVSRVDTAWHPINLTRVLVNLVPESPAGSMDFPVSTAWDNITRTFFVIGSTTKTSAYLWSVSVNSDLTGGSILTKTQVALDDDSGVVVAIVHSQDTLYCIFSGGSVKSLDTRTGNATLVGSIFGNNPTYAGGNVFSALDVDGNGQLFAVIETKLFDKPAISSMDLSSGTATINALNLEHEDWFPETCFEAVYSSEASQLWTFVSGTDNGFDQIIAIDPSTGKATYITQDLSQSGLEFDCDTTTKACDFLQTVAYDHADKKMYFQATMTGSNQGTTCIASVDMASRGHYINVVIEPMVYGFMGYFYASING